MDQAAGAAAGAVVAPRDHGELRAPARIGGAAAERRVAGAGEGRAERGDSRGGIGRSGRRLWFRAHVGRRGDVVLDIDRARQNRAHLQRGRRGTLAPVRTVTVCGFGVVLDTVQLLATVSVTM